MIDDTVYLQGCIDRDGRIPDGDWYIRGELHSDGTVIVSRNARITSLLRDGSDGDPVRQSVLPRNYPGGVERSAGSAPDDLVREPARPDIPDDDLVAGAADVDEPGVVAPQVLDGHEPPGVGLGGADQLQFESHEGSSRVVPPAGPPGASPGSDPEQNR